MCCTRCAGGLPDAKVEEDLSPYIEDDDHAKIYDEIRKGEMTTDDLSALAATMPEAERVLAEGRKVSDKVAEVYFEDCVKKLRELYAKKERKAFARKLQRRDRSDREGKDPR